jgi:hypothetical protein
VAEVSEKLSHISDSEILRSFREALVVLYPILQRLDCISDDTQPYDPFDRVAQTLWNELVLASLQWKYGLESEPRLPPYGFFGLGTGGDGFIEVRSSASPPFRFIQFLGDRSLGVEPFNAVQGVSSAGATMSIRMSDDVSFALARVPA